MHAPTCFSLPCAVNARPPQSAPVVAAPALSFAGQHHESEQTQAPRRTRTVRQLPSKMFYGEPCRALVGPGTAVSSFDIATVRELIVPKALSGDGSFEVRTTDETEAWKYKPVIQSLLNDDDRSKNDLRVDSDFWDLRTCFDKQVDETFEKHLRKLYCTYLRPGMRIFDMMSSTHSHLPDECGPFKYVEGLGLNEAELRNNEQLSNYIVKDLNVLPVKIPCPDQYFDAVLNVCSLQYLQYPELALAEVYRILKPGGIVIFSFSNRMYFDKTVFAWQKRSESSRVDYVRSLFRSVLVRDPPDAFAEKPPQAEGGSRPRSPGAAIKETLISDWAKHSRAKHPELFEDADEELDRAELVRRLLASLTPPASADIQRARDMRGLRYGFLELEVVSRPAPTSGVVIHRELERLKKLGLDHDPFYAVVCQRI